MQSPGKTVFPVSAQFDPKQTREESVSEWTMTYTYMNSHMCKYMQAHTHVTPRGEDTSEQGDLDFFLLCHKVSHAPTFEC